MQQRLKSASGAAWAQIIAAKFLGQLDVAMDDAPTTPYMGFGRERSSAAYA